MKLAEAELTRDNNFDLIRLFAAFEVAVVHANHFMNIGLDLDFLNILPGVPIFFLISGFLIFPSYQASRTLSGYAVKRALRIYPAMHVCFILCILMLLAVGYLAPSFLLSGKFLTWAAGQLLLGHTYTAGFLRDFGSGTLNGSLWTIAVELQFYVMAPVFSFIFIRFPRLWIPTIAVFALINVVFMNLAKPDSLVSALFNVTFVPWVYMFLVGAWLSTRHDIVDRIKTTPLPVFIGLFCAAALVTYFAGLPVGHNVINPLMFSAMAPLIIRLAYTKASLSRHILRGNDFSYGLYIYHMPAINLAIWAGMTASVAGAVAALTLAAILAVLSWFLVEKPALSLKHKLGYRPSYA